MEIVEVLGIVMGFGMLIVALLAALSLILMMLPDVIREYIMLMELKEGRKKIES